jgi:DNA-binding NarL/FixJ family response regulator
MQANMRPRSKPSGTCLIIEDSEFDRERLTRIIGKSHHEMHVEVAATLRSARSALIRKPITLILLDNNLPDGLGANFALELAEDPKLAQIPVILVSDWPSPFMWEKAQSAGVAYVLSKTEFDSRYVHAVMSLMTTRSRNSAQPTLN